MEMDAAYIAQLKVTDVAAEYGGRWDANEDIILYDGSKLSLMDKAELARSIEDYLNADHDGQAFIDYRPNCGQLLFTSAKTMHSLTKRNIRLRIDRVQAVLSVVPAPVVVVTAAATDGGSDYSAYSGSD